MSSVSAFWRALRSRAALAPSLPPTSAKSGVRVNTVAFTHSMPRSGAAANIANSERARDFFAFCRSSMDSSALSAAATKFRPPALVSNPAATSLPALDPSTRGCRALPTHRSAAGAAAASGLALFSRASSVAGLWLTAPRGASVRLTSTNAAARAPSASAGDTVAHPLPASSGSDATEPASAWKPPSVVLVKVGEGGKYLDLTIKWEHLQGLRAGGLLKELKKDEVFGPDLKDVKISGCTVVILKGELPDGQTVPAAADEAADNVVELEGASTVGDTARDSGTGKQLCIRVRLPVPAGAEGTPTGVDSPIELVQFVKVNKAKVRVPSAIRNEAAFDKVIDAGNTVSLVKDEKDHTPIRGIWSWADAVAACHGKEGVLKLETLAGVAEDVSDLKRNLLNHATGVENATTFAVFHDVTLNQKYGPLSLLNDGRGITIYDKRGKAVMEVDGLVLNTTTVLLNECKTALSDTHVVGAPPTAADPAKDTRKMSEKGLKERALAFGHIVNNLTEYTSHAMDALRLCAGKRIVPVASGFFVSPEADKACKDLGIELVVPRGLGGTYAVPASE